MERRAVLAAEPKSKDRWNRCSIHSISPELTTYSGAASRDPGSVLMGAVSSRTRLSGHVNGFDLALRSDGGSHVKRAGAPGPPGPLKWRSYNTTHTASQGLSTGSAAVHSIWREVAAFQVHIY